MTITEPLELVADTDGQTYQAVFEKFFDCENENRCDIFLNGNKIGEAVWNNKDGLIDRNPLNLNHPPQAWNEVCDRIEREYGYRADGHKRALRLPHFKTAREEMLEYKQGLWIGKEHTFEARSVTGIPVDKDGTVVEGTFISHD